MFLTTSERIKNTTEYKKIKEVLDRMERTNLIWLGRGQCISMSEIICSALFQAGIKSKMVECQAIITNKTITPHESVTVGFDASYQSGQIDTHVVLITDTPIPMVVDASISYMLPSSQNIVVEEVVDLGNRIFCDVKSNGFEITYQQKTSNKVIYEYQRSILERIETDKKIFNGMRWLKILVTAAIIVSVGNAARGLYDFHQTYYGNEMVGVSANEEIIKRLDKLEKKLK